MLSTASVTYLWSPNRYFCYYNNVAGDWDKLPHLCQTARNVPLKKIIIANNCTLEAKKKTNLLTSDISCTSKRGILMVVMSCVQQTLRMFLSPMMAGSRAVMFPDLTLSSTQR